MQTVRFITVFVTLGLLFMPSLLFASAPTPIEDEFFRGKVSAIHSITERDEYGARYITQLIDVTLHTGETISLNYEVSAQYESRVLKQGDRVIVGNGTIAGESLYYISDVYRLHSLIWVGILFLILTAVFIGKKAIGAFLGLIISFVVIIYYFVPQVLAGAPPFLTAFIAALLVASVSLFVAHGVYMRTTVAFFEYYNHYFCFTCYFTAYGNGY